jgi:hypothetical protein
MIAGEMLRKGEFAATFYAATISTSVEVIEEGRAFGL